MRRAILFTGVLGVIALSLEGLVRLGVLDTVFFPPPSLVFLTLFQLLGLASFWSEVGTTVAGMGIGFGLAAVVAIPIGIAMGSSKLVRDILDPIVDSLRPMPSAAVIPVAILLLGLGFDMKMAVVVFGSLWPIIINTSDGIRAVDPVLVDTGRLFRLSPSMLLRKIVLPAALPGIFTGMRISLAIALILAVTTEMIAGTNGLGYFILDAQRAFAFREMFAGIVFLGLIGYLFAVGFAELEKRALFWHISVRRDAPLQEVGGTETFSGLEATATEARELRRSLNERFGSVEGQLHSGIPNELWPRAVPSHVLWVGMDVGSYVPLLLRKWPSSRLTAAHWRPVTLGDLRQSLIDGADAERVGIVHWNPEADCLLPGQEGSYDIVGCTYSLHDLDSSTVDLAIARLALLLAPGGRAYFSTHASASFSELHSLYATAAEKCGFRRLLQGMDRHFESFSQETAEARLRRVFETVEFHPRDTTLIFAGTDSLDAFLEYAAIFPFPGLADLSISDRDRLWAAFRESAALMANLKVTKPSGVFVCSGRVKVDAIRR